MRILFGIILSIVGALITIYNEKMLQTFGRVPFAEKYLKTEGGSRLFYQLLGVVVIFFGFLLIFNFYNAFMGWLLSPFINRLK